jgi:hypothetical protein
LSLPAGSAAQADPVVKSPAKAAAAKAMSVVRIWFSLKVEKPASGVQAFAA